MTDPYALSKEDLLATVAKMDGAVSAFYRMAIQTGCHPFIEFTGIMSKYVDICRHATEVGVDFTQASVHSGKAIPLQPHDMMYLAEKMDCIFGPAFEGNPALWDVFVKAMGHGG